MSDACTKRKYRTKRSAKRAMRRQQGEYNGLPRRAYRCPACGGMWHLTCLRKGERVNER
jgi:hypothetical protein